MINSFNNYPDTIISHWVEWNENMLNQQLTNTSNDLNTLFGTSGSSIPTRAKEFYRIGLLKYPLTGSDKNESFNKLRQSVNIQTKLGFISYLIGKARAKDPGNIKVEKAFRIICLLFLLQIHCDFGTTKISLSTIFCFLLDKYPIPPSYDWKKYYRYLSAAMFCELDQAPNRLLVAINSDSNPTLRIIEIGTNRIKATINSSNDVVSTADSEVSLSNIYFQKGSNFFIGNHKESTLRGLFYQASLDYSDFLTKIYHDEVSDLANSSFLAIYERPNNSEVIPTIYKSLNSVNKKTFIDVMISLKQGCKEALKVLDWQEDNDIGLGSVEGKNIIYYGAPGTGKSHQIAKMLEDEPKNQQERVTFHPEYDHASFVGGYKPTMENDVIKYKFVPQVFTNIYKKAWNNLDKNYYLIIEEINRGNCAEIFGDIFQLLDRKSRYDISISTEMQAHLEDELKSEDAKEGIKEGKMKLPPNLFLLATMNTSDQSLFPMDSAFKRRWTWEYVPISYEKDKTKNESANFYIEVEEGSTFEWLDFIEVVNRNHIKINPSLGEDKCIGNYFVQPNNDYKISLREFINKVIFYLWDDVFKDEENDFFPEHVTYENFFPIETNGKELVIKILENLEINIKKEVSHDNNSTQAQVTQVQTDNENSN